MNNKDFERWNASVKDNNFEVQPSSITGQQRLLGWEASRAESAKEIKAMKRDVRQALYPHGLKHPQQQTWEYMIEEIRSLAKQRIKSRAR